MSGQLLLHLSTMSGQPHWLSQPGPSDTALLCVAGGDSFQLPLPLLAAVSPLLQQLLRDSCHLHQPVVLLPMVTQNTLLALTVMLDKGEVVVQSISKRMKRKLGEVMDMLRIVGEIRDLDDIEKETASALNFGEGKNEENGEHIKNHVDEAVKSDNVGPDDSVKNGYVPSTNVDYVNLNNQETVLEANYPGGNLLNSDQSPEFQVDLKVSFQIASPIVKDLSRKINKKKKVSSSAYDEETENKENEEKVNEEDTDSNNLSAQDLIGVDMQEGEVKYQFKPHATPSGKCTGGRYPGYLTIKHTHNHCQTYCLNKIYYGSRDRVTLYYVCIKKKAGCRTKCKVVQVSQRGRLDLVQSSLKEEHNHAVQQVAVN